MRTTLYPFFNHEFITISGEIRPGLPPDEAARDRQNFSIMRICNASSREAL